jgi:geranylgeranyl pyrophosphate synthase
LQHLVNSSGPDLKNIGNYIFDGEGKRIRPALFLMAAYRPNQDSESLVDIAVALELLHTASLLHDDVIDQASIRRGKDAVHARWGNMISVLTGDFLLSQAFELLVSYRNWLLLDLVVDLVKNMAQGEVEQAFANPETEQLEEKYFLWIGKKSAAFFAGCCQAGCLMAGGDLVEQQLWFDYGYNLGITFQLVDDYLDYKGKDQITGKPLYGDLTNGVLTLPLIRAMNSAAGNGLLKSYLKREPDDRQSGAEEMAKLVLNSDGPAYTLQKAEHYAQHAATLIDQLNLDTAEQKSLAAGLPLGLLVRSK